MRKITEIQAGQFSAKVYHDKVYGEWPVKFYHNGSLLPDATLYESDEESARGTANCGLRSLGYGAASCGSWPMRPTTRARIAKRKN